MLKEVQVGVDCTVKTGLSTVVFAAGFIFPMAAEPMEGLAMRYLGMRLPQVLVQMFCLELSHLCLDQDGSPLWQTGPAL